ncbi:MAG TPA: hypothetical protein VFN53_01020 [Acidobacteriaceae bacterium]|nr:hypothetical protein [Acidobacteriaceae bacterium]
MKLVALRAFLFFSFLTALCRPGVAESVLQAATGTKRATATANESMGGHMVMTRLRPVQPGDKAQAAAILAGAKEAAERYRDYHVAEADGYMIFMPDQRQEVYHFVMQPNGAAARRGFDAARPPALLYKRMTGHHPAYKLVGVMYMARFGTPQDELNRRIPLSIVQWHEHVNMCVPPDADQRNWLTSDSKFGLHGSITTAAACEAAGGHFVPHLAGWMTHVYPLETDPAKIWGTARSRGSKGGPMSMSGMKM